MGHSKPVRLETAPTGWPKAVKFSLIDWKAYRVRLETAPTGWAKVSIYF